MLRSRTCLLALAAVLVAASGARTQAGRAVTVEDLMRLRTVLDVKIAPDGERVAYAVSTPSVDTNTHQVELFVVATAGGAPVRVGADAKVYTPALPAARLRWAPDGRRVSFLALADARPQVFVAPADGGRSEPVTAAPQGVIAYEWAPDGRRLAYLSRDAAVRPPVIRAGTTLDPAVRLWVAAPGGPARALTPDGQYVDSLSWSPDGREIAYAAAPVTGFLALYSTRIYAISPDGATPRTLVDRPGMNTMPQFAPDGRSLAFVTTNQRQGILAPRGLAVVGADGDAASIRSFPLGGAWIGELLWTRDSGSILVLMNEGTFATGAHMFEMPVVRVPVDGSPATPVVDGPTVNYSLSITRDGRTLAFRAVDGGPAGGRTMGDVYVQDLPAGDRRRLTEVNPQLRTLARGELRPISWPSFDGQEIWGLLLTPPDWDNTRRLPLIVYCHGGPIGGVTYGLFPQFAHTVGQVDPYPTEALASAGYAVLFPMPRGGSGYGEAGHRAIIDAWGEGDYRDIMAGVDHVIARGVADPDRLGVMGASYGGFMTNWIVTQTPRFKAASAAASISDLADLYYLPDGGDLLVEYFRRPWENRESYLAHSPLTFVERIRTPLLIQHGDRDPRVPIAGAQKLYRALQGLGRTVEYDVYPGGGHVLYEPVQQRESMRRNLEWFQRWIAAAP